MQPPKSFSFRDELSFSEGQSVSTDIVDVLMNAVPGAMSVEKASRESDRSGVDYWVTTESGRTLGVDVKARREDYALRGADDLAIETWSVVEVKKPGWSWDKNKKCDFVLWLWHETGRWCLVSFPQLCAVTKRCAGQWRKQYKTAIQRTSDMAEPYHSECVYVPRTVVWSEIIRIFGGTPERKTA